MMLRRLTCAVLLAVATTAWGSVYTQDFRSTLTGWQLYNDAHQITKAKYLRLNRDVSYTRGQAWYHVQLPTYQFQADFQFMIGPSLDADGMTFGWVAQTDMELGESGQSLGAYRCGYSDRRTTGYDGYFVEIRTFNSRRLALQRSYFDTGPDLISQGSLSLQANQWCDMRVKLRMTDATTAQVQVWMDATPDGSVDESAPAALTGTISNYTMRRGYFGFTAATGAFTEAHYVDRFRLTVPVGQKPWAPYRMTVWPSTVTDDSDLKGLAYESHDVDGLPLWYRYQWQRSLDGGSTWAPCNNTRFLSHTVTQPGDRLRLAARAWNGFYLSDWSYSRTVVIPSAASGLALRATAASLAAGPVALSVNLTRPAAVSAEICNLAGRIVAALPPQQLAAGPGTMLWNGRGAGGTRAPGGQYLVRLQARSADGAATCCTTTFRR